MAKSSGPERDPALGHGQRRASRRQKRKKNKKIKNHKWLGFFVWLVFRQEPPPSPRPGPCSLPYSPPTAPHCLTTPRGSRRQHSLARQVLVGAAGVHQLRQVLPHRGRHVRRPAVPAARPQTSSDHRAGPPAG